MHDSHDEGQWTDKTSEWPYMRVQCSMKMCTVEAAGSSALDSSAPWMFLMIKQRHRWCLAIGVALKFAVALIAEEAHHTPKSQMYFKSKKQMLHQNPWDLRFAILHNIPPVLDEFRSFAEQHFEAFLPINELGFCAITTSCGTTSSHVSLQTVPPQAAHMMWMLPAAHWRFDSCWMGRMTGELRLWRRSVLSGWMTVKFFNATGFSLVFSFPRPSCPQSPLPQTYSSPSDVTAL